MSGLAQTADAAVDTLSTAVAVCTVAVLTVACRAAVTSSSASPAAITWTLSRHGRLCPDVLCECVCECSCATASDSRPLAAVSFNSNCHSGGQNLIAVGLRWIRTCCRQKEMDHSWFTGSINSENGQSCVCPVLSAGYRRWQLHIQRK